MFDLFLNLWCLAGRGKIKAVSIYYFRVDFALPIANICYLYNKFDPNYTGVFSKQFTPGGKQQQQQ